MKQLFQERKEIILVITIFYLAILFWGYLLNAFFPSIQTNQEPLLFTDLIGKSFKIHPLIIPLFGLGNMVLIWLIGCKLINRKTALLALLVYAISPWSAYLEVAGSLYIYFTFYLLLSFYGIIRLKENSQPTVAGLIFVGGVVVLLYSSLLMWFIVPPLIFFSLKIKFISWQLFRRHLLVLAIVCLIVPLLALRNFQGILNIAHSQITIYSDPGILNTVNVYRGESSSSNLGFLSKFVENKYIYFSQHLILSFLNQFTPAIYFTSQFKLLNFSFSPPVLFGFMIPFFVGLKYLITVNKRYAWGLFAVLVLMVPSVLSQGSPDISRLFLVAPLIFITIAHGLDKIITLHQSKFSRLLLSIIVLLVAVQIIILIPDIKFREPTRMNYLQLR